MSDKNLGKLKKKYKGEVAQKYEQKRIKTEHWKQEQKIIENLLDRSGLPSNSKVLDIPVGTGRFLHFYQDRGYKVVGLDASPDMLSEAEEKADDLGYDDVRLDVGDITDISLTSNSADLTLCIRLMNWFNFRTFQRALSELARVSSQYVIVGVRMSAGWTRTAFYPWLKEALRAGKQDLRASVKRTVQRLLSDDTQSHETDVSELPLVDHREARVRNAFQQQGLTIVQEEPAIMFTGEPRLSGLGRVRELPYVIFLLRV